MNEALTDSEILALVGIEFENSELFAQQIEEERKDALDYYNSEPLGNEEDGLSRYVSSDVRDAVEWLLPNIIEVFLGTTAAVKFTPIGKEDIKQAEVETAYCQYAFNRKNGGFLILYEWFKTALVQKNGIVKVYWGEEEKEEEETYRNQGYIEFMELVNDEELEIQNITIYYMGKEYSEQEFGELLEDVETQIEYEEILGEARADVDAVRKKTIGKPCIDSVEPENFFVNRDHNSLDLTDCKYSCHRYIKTAYELIDEGFSEDVVRDLPTLGDLYYDDEKVNRFKKEGGDFASENSFDEGRREIEIREHYIYADVNGDGKSRLWKIRSVGTRVLDKEPEDRNPFHAITPYINPFKFYGRSVADNVESLQRVNTQLWRGALDNIMYSVIPRKIISGNVDIDDLLTYIPGGVIRKEANATVENENIPFVAEAVFPMLDQTDKVRSERTGFSRDTVGLNPSSLANSTNLVGSMIMNQSQVLSKMIARIFAETGYKSMMLHIRELMYKYEDNEVLFEMAGEYVVTDPRTWKKERDTEVQVGLGFASKQEEIAFMNELLNVQQRLVEGQGGIDGYFLSPKHIYNGVTKLAKTIGMKDVDNYFRDPETYEPPPPEPTQGDIQLELAGKQIEMQAHKEEADTAIEMQKIQMDAEEKEKDRRLQLALQQQELESKEKMHEQELIYKYGELSTKKINALTEEMTNEQRRTEGNGVSSQVTD